jgi:hypothetical protein
MLQMDRRIVLLEYNGRRERGGPGSAHNRVVQELFAPRVWPRLHKQAMLRGLVHLRDVPRELLLEPLPPLFEQLCSESPPNRLAFRAARGLVRPRLVPLVLLERLDVLAHIVHVGTERGQSQQPQAPLHERHPDEAECVAKCEQGQRRDGEDDVGQERDGAARQ